MSLSINLELPNGVKYEQPLGLWVSFLLIVLRGFRSQTVLRFINNEFVKGVEGKTFEVVNPRFVDFLGLGRKYDER